MHPSAPLELDGRPISLEQLAELSAQDWARVVRKTEDGAVRPGRFISRPDDVRFHGTTVILG